MSKQSKMGAVFGTDAAVIAKCVEATDAYGPMLLRALAAYCKVGEAKIAITMKYAVKAGYMESTGRLPQNSWTRTAMGLEVFPPGQAQVLPDAEQVEISPGVTVTGVSGVEADQWEQIEEPERRELGP